MAVLSFRRQPKNELESGGRSSMEADRTDPKLTCPNCRKTALLSEVRAGFNVCPRCGFHMMIGARQRIGMITDKNSFTEMFSDIVSCDPLEFPGYTKKISAAGAASSENEAVICGRAVIGGCPCAVFVMEPHFMMGSMGSAVGERITRTFEYALEERLPVVGFTVSGGARMQEGLYSLMQMAKTAGAVKRHSDAGLLYIVMLTSPTTGGVTASFAMEADITLAEPGATIGFAGARVVEQTTRKSLPKGFQTAESMQEHGFVDVIVPRAKQKRAITRLLRYHAGAGDASAGKMTRRDGTETPAAGSSGEGVPPVVKTAYDSVKIARSSDRPTGLDYIKGIFTEFTELHGDRLYGDDRAIIGGIGRLEGLPVTVIAIEKGHTVKERTFRRSGAPEPEGYRKALRLMKEAEKFGRPIICFIDTSGAYCGIDAEERGQGRAIAENLMEMMSLKVPIISILVGEGGSGGALALAVANRVWMLENSVYSVISPEGCASILWKDVSKAEEAAGCLKLTAADSYRALFAEEIISEENIGSKDFYEKLKTRLKAELSVLSKSRDPALERFERFRAFGKYNVTQQR